MTIKAATPYAILHGHADRAIEFYKGALGAEVKALMRFSQMPNCPDAMKNNVMHCELAIGQARLMVSDSPESGDLPPRGGVHIALDIEGQENARKLFANLAKDGTVETELFAAPWGALFGAIRDPFGVQWMFNVDLK